jgi:hypothetical protein
LVSQAEIQRSGANSPLGVTLALWRAVQVGDFPSAASLYHSRVQHAVGVRNIAGPLAAQRSTVALLRPQVVSVSHTPVGMEVTLRATSGGSSIGTQFFLLRRTAHGWRVAYDSLVGDALETFIREDVTNRLLQNSSHPSPREKRAASRTAKREARRILTLYRTLFLSARSHSDRP